MKQLDERAALSEERKAELERRREEMRARFKK